MTCADIQIVIDESFLSGGIKLADEIKKHTATCPACQNYLIEMTSLSDDLNLVSQIELTSAESEAMVSALSKEIQPKRVTSRFNITSLIRSGLAAAAIIIISFLARPDDQNPIVNFTIDQYWEELQMTRINPDDLSLLLVNGDGTDYLPSLIDTAEAKYLTNQIPAGQIDDLLFDIDSEELEYLAQNYAMEM